MKKTISIIMIILMVILVSGKCFATDGALDLTNTLGTPDSTNDSIVDFIALIFLILILLSLLILFLFQIKV